MKQHVTVRTVHGNTTLPRLISHTRLEVSRGCRIGREFGLANLIRDPLIRLVMKSDGVTEQAMMALIHQVRDALADCAGNAGRVGCDPAARRGRGHAGSAVVIPFPAARHEGIGGGIRSSLDDAARSGQTRSDG